MMYGSIRQRFLFAPAFLFFMILGCLTAHANTNALLLDFASLLRDRSNYGNLDSILIWQDGEILMEQYIGNFDANKLHPIFSTSKSVTSALVGIAIEQGAIDNVEHKILDYFPNYTPTNPDPRKEEITLAHLLEMRAGFVWDELSTLYGEPSNALTLMIDSGQDWFEYVLDLELAADPGSEYAYSSGVTTLLSGILEEATGQTAENFAVNTLFQDLGIEKYSWESSPYGYTNTGWGLNLLPRDMLKFGKLYLNEGYVHPDGVLPGKQVLPAEWVAESIQPYTVGEFADDIGGPYDYGYQWWRFDDDSETVSNLTTNDVYFTWGYGGQFIFVVPHLNAIVVSTGSNYGNSEILFPALSDHIFPVFQQLAIPEPTSIGLIACVVLGLLCIRPHISCKQPTSAHD